MFPVGIRMTIFMFVSYPKVALRLQGSKGNRKSLKSFLVLPNILPDLLGLSADEEPPPSRPVPPNPCLPDPDFGKRQAYMSVELTVCLSVCSFECLSICLSVCLSVGLSVCLSVCLSVACLSAYLIVGPKLLDQISPNTKQSPN